MARNGKFREWGKTERNLRGSYKSIDNCEIKFKACVDDSIKNTRVREATKRDKIKILKKHLKNQKSKIATKKISGVSKYNTKI